MKMIYLFLMLFAATALNAQVAFLKVEAELPDYGDEQPEQNAYDWFVATYVDGNVVDMNHIPTDASTYKVLWVNVERDITEEGFDNLFPADKRTALSNYVKAGGNLLLTKKASRLACHIGRMGDRVGGTYYPSWNNSGYSVGEDIWTINAMIGVGCTLRDARQHPIFKDMTKGLYNDYTHESFPLIGTVNRSNDNCIWTEMERKDGAQRAANNNLYHLQEFESSWNCQVLAVWGHVTDYCGPVIVEFFPQNEYKGTVLSIGSNAYQWGTSNYDAEKGHIANVKKLTQNALTYLSQGGVKYGYYLPYSLSEIYSIDQYQPEYQAAKWFYDNYVVPGNGRFIHKDEVFPTGMKVLWVHGDRVGQGNGDFYNAFGGDDFKTKLQAFVVAGGNVFLSKQATRFTNDIGRCTWAPSYDQSSYNDGSDTWYMVSNFVSIDVDRHNHPAFQYMQDYTEHGSEGDCKWPLVNGDGTYKRSDHKYMWGEPGDVWSDTYGISAGSTEIARLNAFESAQNCQILGGWGHTTALDGVTMVEFLPTASFAGTVIAQGVPAYQWTTPNTAIYNVKNLTQGVLEYLSTATVVVTDPDTEIPSTVNYLVVYQGGSVSNTGDITIRDSITYIYDAAGDAGAKLGHWYTFCLPFEASKCYVVEDGVNYDINAVYLTNEQEDANEDEPAGEGYFYLQSYNGSGWDYIGNNGIPVKDTPYIIKFLNATEDDCKGAALATYFTKNRSIKFVGGAQTINGTNDATEGSPSGDYSYHANKTLRNIELTHVYTLNTETNQFEYDYGSTSVIAPFECYIKASTPARALANPRLALRPRGSKEQTEIATSMDHIADTTAQTQKILYNGQVVIVRDNKMYNVLGQEL